MIRNEVYMDKRKVRACIAIFIIIIICVVLFLVFRNKDHEIQTGLKIEFVSETKEIEYGSNFDSKELVKSTTGEIKEYPVIDTSKIGEQEIVFVVERNGVDKKFPYKINVVDTQKPIITFKHDSVEILIHTEFKAEEVIQSVKDDVDGDIPYSEGTLEKNTYTISSDVDSSSEGSYTVVVKAMDKNENISEKSISVEVRKEVSNANHEDIEPTYIKGILLVNKQYGLPRDFGGLDAVAFSALNELQAAAAVEGFSMQMISGYRSYDYQVDLYNSYVARDGQAAADRYSARPGYSEHQTGLCFDVGDINDDYGSTPAGKWLDAHAHEYGFIIRFPDGKEEITGYMYEPWHIRYVGKEAATEIYQKGITLEEYLGVA